MAALRVLIVEDEPDIRDLLVFHLERDGYQVVKARSGADALRQAQASPPDLVLLDLMLPEMDGLEVCRRLRQNPVTQGIPIVMLTARGDEVDRVLGLEMGADDYVVKPFSPRELVARVRARLRRAAAPTDGEGWRETGEFAIDAAGQRIRYRGEVLPLTRYEHRLLAALLARPGAILSREQLMDDVWRDAPDTVDRTVDTHVKTLRAKLRAVSEERDPIRTHRGLGYSVESGRAP